MTLIYDPIEALQRIEKLIDESLWRLDGKKISDDDAFEIIQSVINDLDEVSLICDTVLFMEGLKWKDQDQE